MFEFCLPTRSTSVPDGPDWLHEVKYDGYRLRLERDGGCVRLITRGGYDWTKKPLARSAESAASSDMAPMTRSPLKPIRGSQAAAPCAHAK
jgi:ATP-dependent DNA ligase